MSVDAKDIEIEEHEQLVHVSLTGYVTIPKEWKQDGEGFDLPNGRRIKFWPCVELIDEKNDSYETLSGTEAFDMGIDMDGYVVNGDFSIEVVKTGGTS